MSWKHVALLMVIAASPPICWRIEWVKLRFICVLDSTRSRINHPFAVSNVKKNYARKQVLLFSFIKVFSVVFSFCIVSWYTGLRVSFDSNFVHRRIYWGGSSGTVPLRNKKKPSLRENWIFREGVKGFDKLRHKMFLIDIAPPSNFYWNFKNDWKCIALFNRKILYTHLS